MSASTTPTSSASVPWWKEPTKDQWYAYVAAWLGWTLDAFDFTIFLLIMVPIAESLRPRPPSGGPGSRHDHRTERCAR